MHDDEYRRSPRTSEGEYRNVDVQVEAERESMARSRAARRPQRDSPERTKGPS